MQDTGFKHLVQACSEPTCILVLVRAGGAGNSACPKSTPDYRYSDASTPFVHASDETIISYLTIEYVSADMLPWRKETIRDLQFLCICGGMGNLSTAVSAALNPSYFFRQLSVESCAALHLSDYMPHRIQESRSSFR